MSYPELSVLIPAAGASTRLGQAKQLVDFKGKSLIQTAVDSAHALAPREIIVVTGANAAAVRHSVDQPAVEWVHNKNWRRGLGASIAHGMASLDQQSKGVLILLCDQWRIETQDLHALAEIWCCGNQRIVCANVERVNMPPAIFPLSCFEQLEKLQGDQGARSLLLARPELVQAVLMQNAAFDLDTPEQMTYMKDLIKSDMRF